MKLLAIMCGCWIGAAAGLVIGALFRRADDGEEMSD